MAIIYGDLPHTELALKHELDPEDLIPGYNGLGTFEDVPALLDKLQAALKRAPKPLRKMWGLPLKKRGRKSREAQGKGVLLVAIYGSPEDEFGNLCLYKGGTGRFNKLQALGSLAEYNACIGDGELKLTITQEDYHQIEMEVA
jgi:hypothetical protein